MSIGRTFTEEVIAVGDSGGRVLAMKIVCAECGSVAYFAHQTGKSRKPPVAAQQSFQNKGWVVGSGPRKDFCPLHAAPASRKGQTAMKHESMPAPAAKAEPPRASTIEDRRVINMKLTEVYADGGYATPWTDQKVADDLGVPRAWVTEIREQMYGPEGSNPLLDDYLTAQAAFTAECKALADGRVDLVRTAEEVDTRIRGLHADVVDQVKAACRKVADLAADIRRRGDELDGKARDILALGKRVEREIGR